MSKKIITLCSLVLLASASTVARADTISTFAVNTPNGGTPLSASAVFTASAGDLKIVISNTLGASLFVSSSQAISDLSFTLSNGPGTLSSDSATGQLGNIGSTGVVTYLTGAGSTSPTRWLGTGGGVAPSISRGHG